MDATYLNSSSHNKPRAPTPTKLVGLHLTTPYPGVTWPGIPDSDPTLVLVVRSHETCTQFQLKAIAAADIPLLQKGWKELHWILNTKKQERTFRRHSNSQRCPMGETKIQNS